MRLIDADALSRKIQDEYHGSYSEVQIAPYQIDRMIDAQPTVDAARVVHTHWKLAPEDTAYENVWTCSNCGEELIQHRKPKFRYCPNCGAFMTEEKNDG